MENYSQQEMILIDKIIEIIELILQRFTLGHLRSLQRRRSRPLMRSHTCFLRGDEWCQQPDNERLMHSYCDAMSFLVMAMLAHWHLL